MKHTEDELWLDICRRNPIQEGELFSDWLDRLGDLMTSWRPSDDEKDAGALG